MRVGPRIVALILGPTLTLPALRAGPFPLLGRERESYSMGGPMKSRYFTVLSSLSRTEGAAKA
ncbi:hypothetical protein DS843_29280 [Roseomonas genomospecies 6]|uniref:Uncharacterized protein n=1 Tax=Roseomonas genomospecies 6 TaxID=214106 RepID=A0A9W7NF89_9PROT|nr:hypothetical protein DS843_29280 [Roseomonas genomospecies 6]